MFTAALAAKEAHLLECPITGGLEALKKGQMAVWGSGDKGGVTQCCAVLSQLSRTSQEAYTKVKAVLDASYSSVMYTGGLGTAMIPKVMVVMEMMLITVHTQVLSNMLCGLQVCAMAEAMLIGKQVCNLLDIYLI